MSTAAGSTRISSSTALGQSLPASSPGRGDIRPRSSRRSGFFWDGKEVTSCRELLALIRGTWLARGDRYSEQREELRRSGRHEQKIEMFYIGG